MITNITKRDDEIVDEDLCIVDEPEPETLEQVYHNHDRINEYSCIDEGQPQEGKHNDGAEDLICKSKVFRHH